jgi:hypothetical protein
MENGTSFFSMRITVPAAVGVRGKLGDSTALCRPGSSGAARQGYTKRSDS